MKLFQLMVEHTPDEENIDWTKIEPSVNFLKSPKGTCSWPLPLWAFSGLELGQGQCWCLPACGPSTFAGAGCGCGLGSWVSKPC